MRLTEYNYREGTFSYGARIGVGMILQDESLSEYQRLKGCWKELYGWNARLMPPRMRHRRFRRMLEGIEYWVELESQTLKYDPTPEQERAGIKKLFNEVGHMGTVKAIAEKFAFDPDVVLDWQWAKVYGILHADLKEYLYERKLTEIMSNKRR